MEARDDHTMPGDGPVRRIHILGASGAGTSTLGRALADRLGLQHFDTDDFFWLPSDPPFQVRRPTGGRLSRLGAALDEASGGWVLSGALDPWGDPLIPRFALVVFLTLEPGLRLARLRERERVAMAPRLPKAAPCTRPILLLWNGQRGTIRPAWKFAA